MIPDQEAMRELALTAERELALDGWDDTPPMFGIILGHRADAVKTYGVLPFPVQPYEIAPDDVVGGLKAMGRSMVQFKPGKIMQRGALADLAGVFFSSEAWHSTIPEDQRDGRRLADIPGSQEARTVYILDTAGRFIFVQRIRGEKPTVEVTAAGKFDVTGRLVDGMRMVLLAMAREMPLGTADLDAIRQVGVKHEQD